LRAWTTEELQGRGLYNKYGDLFVITDVSPVTTPPLEFFGGTHWYPPFTAGPPDSLIDLPVSAAVSPEH
jgi:hypothetical protein